MLDDRSWFSGPAGSTTTFSTSKKPAASEPETSLDKVCSEINFGSVFFLFFVFLMALKYELDDNKNQTAATSRNSRLSLLDSAFIHLCG